LGTFSPDREEVKRWPLPDSIGFPNALSISDLKDYNLGASNTVKSILKMGQEEGLLQFIGEKVTKRPKRFHFPLGLTDPKAPFKESYAPFIYSVVNKSSAQMRIDEESRSNKRKQGNVKKKDTKKKGTEKTDPKD
jgi:hypothetical protein